MAKPKLTPELEKDICRYIAQGLTKRTAIDACGISEVTFYAWLNRGEAELAAGKETIYTKFLKGIKEAETKDKLSRLKVIRQAATDGSWQAAAWELERRYRDEYGRNAVDAKIEMTGKDGGPVETKSTVQVYIPDNGRDKE